MNNSISSKIKQLRQQQGLTQVDLAKRLGVSKQRIHKFEKSSVRPSVEMLERLAKALNVSINYLFADILLSGKLPEFDDKEDVLLGKFRSLSDENKEFAVRIINII